MSPSPYQSCHPLLIVSSTAVLGVVLSMGRRRLRVVRGMQTGTEKGTVAGGGRKGETEEGTDDTMLELLRLKVSGDSPEHREGG